MTGTACRIAEKYLDADEWHELCHLEGCVCRCHPHDDELEQEQQS